MGSNMRTSWIKVLLLSFLGGTFLPACSTVNTLVPENMQFWDGISSFSEDSPNLNDTPSDEAIRQAREEAGELRKQLESDRDRARRLAMGLPLPDDMAEQSNANYNQEYTLLTQTQRSMWIRHDNLMSGTLTPEIVNPVVEQDLPPEMFVPSNVVINYDIVPEAQYQPPLYAEQAKDYVQTGNILTNPSEISDLIDYQPIETQVPTDEDSKKKSEFIPPLAYGDPAGLLFFAFGSAELSDTDIAFLQDIATEIKETTGLVRIVGHASPDVKADNPAQGRAKNLMMSDRRAAGVLKMLVGFGVDKDRIEVSAYGDSIPLFAIEGKTPEEADRRVEIYY